MRDARRRGMTMVEATVAAAVVAALMALAAQVLTATATQRRESERRQLAALEAANLVEWTRSQAIEAVQSGDVPPERFTPEARRRLPDLSARRIVAEEGEGLGRRVRIELRWQTTAGTPARFGLTTWIFPATGGSS